MVNVLIRLRKAGEFGQQDEKVNFTVLQITG